MSERAFVSMLAVAAAASCLAKVDLVTLPERDRVQLTIYNSADLTLVREARDLTLREGANRLQFSWAETLIDPTSLEMRPLAAAAQIDVAALVYPPRVQNLGLWQIDSEVAGKQPFEITYFTSGISWRAFYMGTLSQDEATMRLQGYVRVTNNSGEDYANAVTRLIVGKVNLLDQIAQLAQRQPPYGRPGATVITAAGGIGMDNVFEVMEEAAPRLMGEAKRKEIKKEGLSEYFLYTIEGRETIPTGWSKRLPSFEAAEVPVVNLYKYEEERWGQAAVRFLSFSNDEGHQLGDTPIPGGMLKVYRQADAAAHLSYEGQSSFKYIPVGEDVELNLGAVTNVVVEPTLMSLRYDRFSFDDRGNVNGWDELREWRVVVKNTRPVAVKVEVHRNFPHQYWNLTRGGDYDDYERVDLDTIKFLLALQPHSERTLTYVHTQHEGTRRE